MAQSFPSGVEPKAGHRCCLVRGAANLDQPIGEGPAGLDRIGNTHIMGDLAIGLKMYREAGGTRAILANILTDFRDTPAALPSHVPKITLFCSPREARDRRLEDLGLDDALLVVPAYDPGQLETIAGLIA